MPATREVQQRAASPTTRFSRHNHTLAQLERPARLTRTASPSAPSPTVATLASPATTTTTTTTTTTPSSLSPLHAAQLLHLVVQLAFTCHALGVASYLLSPSHLLILVLRVALQSQFTNPRTTHPSRSLRFFVALWAAQALIATVGHALTGSRGTKGPRGYTQGGIVLDWIGQAATPSTAHLLLLDVLLAFFQLATILLAFGATVPSDLDASAGGESARDYVALLGVFTGDEEEGEEEMPRARRRRSGYEGVPLRDEDEYAVEDDELDALDAEADAFGLGSLKPSSSSSSSSMRPHPQAQYTRLPLIADIRLRTVWAEVRKSAHEVRVETEEAGVRGMEEGRGGGGEV